MDYIVKSEEQEESEEARYRAAENDLLASVGVSRNDFTCFEGVAPADEHVIVWSLDEAHFSHEPRNLVTGGWNAETGHWEYCFMPLTDPYVGMPTVESY